ESNLSCQPVEVALVTSVFGSWGENTSQAATPIRPTTPTPSERLENRYLSFAASTREFGQSGEHDSNARSSRRAAKPKYANPPAPTAAAPTPSHSGNVLWPVESTYWDAFDSVTANDGSAASSLLLGIVSR